MSNQTKVFKKGEVLYKDGDKVQSVYFIQSGGVNQCLIRGKKNVDLFQLGASQVLGESGLVGTGLYQTSAVATAETTVIEVPVETLRQQYESTTPLMKMFVKSIVDRLKQATIEVRGAKTATDPMPCPEEVVAQVFGGLFIAATMRSEKVEKTKEVVLEWASLKTYTQRVLGGSTKRMEQAMNIMVKLKAARYEKGEPMKDSLPEIEKVYMQNLPALEAFVEFFQYYVFKPRRGDILKYDDFCAQLLEVLVEEGDKATPDRHGVVAIPFNQISELVKKKIGQALTADHFARLEARGILCKRREITGVGVNIEFDAKEYRHMLFSWRILRELEKWNEKGFVDVDEKEERAARKSPTACPQCSAEPAANAKFCAECGTKLGAAAA